MKKVLILGANGRIAKIAERFMLADDQLEVTLYLRNPERLNDLTKGTTAKVIDGDVLDNEVLTKAMTGQDVVYANLAGENIVAQAQAVKKAMIANHVTRLIWISTIGIYDEVPGKFGEWNNETLGDYLTRYRAAADIFEESDLAYTIIRPAWLTDANEVDYELTGRNDAFKGTEVSRKSIAALVYHLVKNPDEHVQASLGVNKPNTDGDKPAWY